MKKMIKKISAAVFLALLCLAWLPLNASASEKTEIKMIRASRLDIEKAVNVLEKSLSFQNAEVSRMKTKIKIMERAVIEQRKIAERLKKTYLSE